MNGFIGTIMLFAGNFAPRDWLFCDGSELLITSYEELFSIIGNTYGGDGVTTFKLPDLRGRVPLGTGNGPGLLPYELGQAGGQETHMLTTLEMPVHNHLTQNAVTADQNIQLSTDKAVNETPALGDVPAVANFGSGLSATTVKSFGPATNSVSGQTISGSAGLTILDSGANFPHNNMQPFLGLNYIICKTPNYPQR